MYYYLVYGPADFVIWQIEKKIEKSVFLFLPILIYSNIMDQNIKNIKKSALMPRYTHKFL